MKISVGPDPATLENFRQAFLKLRPRINYEGDSLVLRHKTQQFSIPLTLGTTSKGYSR